MQHLWSINILTKGSILSGKIITCLVGPTEIPVTVHATALGRFLKTQSVEEFDNTIHIPDVDETTFTHCCSFAYTGDYSVAPEPVPGNRVDSPKERLFDRNNLSCNLFHPQLLPHFHALLQRYMDTRPAFQPSSMKPADDYTEVFLCHARIYRYAFRSDCAALCVLSLNYLSKVLEGLVLCPSHIKDLVRLLRFVFEESEFMDNLQHVLCDYMVWNVETLMQDSVFLAFLDQCPDLEGLIFRRMWP